jgi:hypothetical protein
MNNEEFFTDPVFLDDDFDGDFDFDAVDEDGYPLNDYEDDLPHDIEFEDGAQYMFPLGDGFWTNVQQDEY